MPAGAAHAAVINGTIHKIDGDKDGQADDVRISQFTFTVTAGTTVFFDSLAYEATNVDLNGDGFRRRLRPPLRHGVHPHLQPGRHVHDRDRRARPLRL